MNPVKVKAVLDSLTLEDVMRELEGRYDEVLCHQPRTNYKRGGESWKRVTLNKNGECYWVQSQSLAVNFMLPRDAVVRVRGDELIWKDAEGGEWTFKFVVQSSLRLETFFGLLVEN